LAVRLTVLTWNLFHGRAVPAAGRSLLDEFAATLAGWDWDVALLQEVPPWWGPQLARRAQAEGATALTSRNALLPVRRRLADRWPDVMCSNGGGANVILSRSGLSQSRSQRLRRWPERRVVHAVRLPTGVWVANLHGSAHREARARADLVRAERAVLAWAGAAPVVLGGDLNLRAPTAGGLAHAAGHSVDHVLVRGLRVAAAPEQLVRGALSDHVPLRVSLA
jgi:endonuclease/exonuclease/phosphatase family metal-dependent hydrolase